MHFNLKKILRPIYIPKNIACLLFSPEFSSPNYWSFDESKIDKKQILHFIRYEQQLY